MRIVHLSDIHIGTHFKKSNFAKTKKLIKIALETGFDHLVITGDISDNAEKRDYLLFRKILKSFDLLDKNKTSLVIGNHDIYGGVQTALDVVNFPAKCLKIDYEQKVREFFNHFKELFEDCYFPLENKIFPYSKMIGDTQLIGLNTIDLYSRIKNPFASNGKVYRDQFEGIKKIFKNKEFSPAHKVILAHHHFYKKTEKATSSSKVWNKIESYTLKLRGKKRLLKLFKENDVELILHGHSHDIREYDRKGMKLINAGGSIDNNLTKNIFLILIDINNTLNVSISAIDLTAREQIPSVTLEKYIPSLSG